MLIVGRQKTYDSVSRLIEVPVRRSPVPHRTWVSSRILPAQFTRLHPLGVRIDKITVRQPIVTIYDARLVAHPLIISGGWRHKQPHTEALPAIGPFGERYPKIGVGLARILHVGDVAKENRLRRLLHHGILHKRARRRINNFWKNTQLVEIHADP